MKLDELSARKTALQAELQKIQWEEKKCNTLRQNIDIVLKIYSERYKQTETFIRRNEMILHSTQILHIRFKEFYSDSSTETDSARRLNALSKISSL
ncbi:MAG: hypothetical protein EP146_16635 [Oscillibacter sp.]|uniref:hypothetical protein n=1 Tax=Oscillibacter sp. TaxID=1945593 RepID=UPI001323049E|nr:hypothetical protein [Oscillibacter sp.]MUU12857.1 hypothetical protein [Oscillibacter sp.]